MDNFWHQSRRLAFAFLAVLAISAFGSFGRLNEALAETYSDAMSQCQAQVPINESSGDFTDSCGLDPTNSQQVLLTQCNTQQRQNEGYGTAGVCGPNAVWPFTGAAPASNPCSNLVGGGSQNYAGQYYKGENLNIPVTSNGATVMCSFALTPLAPPVQNQWGSWSTYVSVSQSANPSGGDGNGASGVVNSDGSTPSPQPPAPSAAPTTNTPAPQDCGGSSCFDPNTNNFCATGDGGQVCVSGSAATTPAGGCATSGSATLCAGSPLAPAPPAASVPDPATQVQGTDQTNLSSAPGAVQTVTTNVYSTTAGSTSSGQKSTDTGPTSTSVGNSSGASAGGATPASGSSSPSASSGTYGGGGDCNNPPVCTGDAVLCGIGRQTWYAQCSAHTDAGTLLKAVAGDNNGPPTFSSDQNKYSQSSVWVQPSTGDTVGDQANAGSYNQGGFGYATKCPLTDIPVTKLGIVIPMSNGCDPLSYLYYIIVGWALYRAALITAGSS